MHLYKRMLSKRSKISDFIQQTFLGSKTKQQLEKYSISDFTEQISEIRDIRNGEHKEGKQKGE